MTDQVVETFKRAVKRELDGHTFGELPQRFIASHFGEVVIPASAVVDTTESLALWRSAYDTINARIAVAGGGDNLAPGVWFDDERDAFIWDMSTSFNHLSAAFAFGSQNMQKSLYDSELDKCEDVPNYRK